MLRYPIAFFVIIVAAALLAFGGIAFPFQYTAKIVFFIALPLFVISSLFSAVLYKKQIIEKKQLPRA